MQGKNILTGRMLKQQNNSCHGCPIFHVLYKNLDVLSELSHKLNSLYTQFSFTGLSLEKSEMRNLMRILNFLTLNPVNSRVKDTFSSALVGGFSADNRTELLSQISSLWGFARLLLHQGTVKLKL